jgi:hypothetical protein
MAEDAAEVKKLDPAIIYGYVMNRLSCVFQKGISNTINTRVATLNGHLTRASNRGFAISREFVATHEQFRAVGIGE